MLRRLAPWLALTAGCAPLGGELVFETTDSPGGTCDDQFAASEAWSFKINDYGMVRGADQYGALDTFVLTSGTYQVTTRTFDVPTGAVLSEQQLEERWLVARDQATDTDLVFDQGDVDLVSTLSGDVRGTVRDVSPTWMWPSVSLDGGTLIAMRCDDAERVSLTEYDLDGQSVATHDLLATCSHWSAGVALDYSSDREIVAFSGDALGGAAEIVDLNTGRSLALTPHDPPADGESPMVGLVHDLALSPDGLLLATAGLDQRLLLHDTRTGELVGERPVRRTHVNRNIYAQPDTRSPFAWSADGRLLARGLEDDTIVVERLCDGEILATLDIDPTLTPLHSVEGAAPSTLHFAPDGTSLMATYEGGVQAFTVD